MGRKTRREKILAEQRRRAQLLNALPKGISFLGQSTITPEEPRVSGPAMQTPTLVARSSSPASTSSLDYSYVLSDLRRIGLLTGLAICAQLVLWYVLRK